MFIQVCCLGVRTGVELVSDRLATVDFLIGGFESLLVERVVETLSFRVDSPIGFNRFGNEDRLASLIDGEEFKSRLKYGLVDEVVVGFSY